MCINNENYITKNDRGTVNKNKKQKKSQGKNIITHQHRLKSQIDTGFWKGWIMRREMMKP